MTTMVAIFFVYCVFIAIYKAITGEPEGVDNILAFILAGAMGSFIGGLVFPLTICLLFTFLFCLSIYYFTRRVVKYWRSRNVGG